MSTAGNAGNVEATEHDVELRLRPTGSDVPAVTLVAAVTITVPAELRVLATDLPTTRTVPMPTALGCTAAPTVPSRRQPARSTGRDHRTRFQPGNSAWAARRSPGRHRHFADPAMLEAACIRYFEWCAANPLIGHEPVVYRGKVTMMLAVPKLRALTLAGLYVHLDIGRSTWRGYRARPDFSPVIEWVENAIRVEQFEGAAAGLLDARIVARMLGTGGMD